MLLRQPCLPALPTRLPAWPAPAPPADGYELLCPAHLVLGDLPAVKQGSFYGTGRNADAR